MKKKQSQVPLRELKWKKYDYLRNKENNTFYYCQCGKKYFNFPGIYMHLDRKHHKKVRNLNDKSKYQLIRSKNETIYFFPIRKNRTQSHTEEQDLLNELKTVSAEFRYDCRNELMQKGFSFYVPRLFQNLEQYVEQQQKEYNSQSSNQFGKIMGLPQQFNSFATSKYFGHRNSEQYNIFSCILYLFSEWLNLKCYTNLKLQLNILNEYAQKQQEKQTFQ